MRRVCSLFEPWQWRGRGRAPPSVALSLTHGLELQQQHALLGQLLVCPVHAPPAGAPVGGELGLCHCFLRVLFSDTGLIFISPVWLSSSAVSLLSSLTFGGGNLRCDFPGRLFAGPSRLSVLCTLGSPWKSGVSVSTFPSLGSGCAGGQMETGQTS